MTWLERGTLIAPADVEVAIGGECLFKSELFVVSFFFNFFVVLYLIYFSLSFISCLLELTFACAVASTADARGLGLDLEDYLIGVSNLPSELVSIRTFTHARTHMRTHSHMSYKKEAYDMITTHIQVASTADARGLGLNMKDYLIGVSNLPSELVNTRVYSHTHSHAPMHPHT